MKIPKPSQIPPSRRPRMILTPYDPRNLNVLLSAQVFGAADVAAFYCAQTGWKKDKK